MDTLTTVLIYSRRAAACALAVVLCACGGGGGGGAAPEAGITAMTAVPAPAADVAAQPGAGGVSPIVVPSPPDMSIEPPPGTVVTAAPPDVSASVASTVSTVDTTGTGAAPTTTVTPADQASVELPPGAVACQPSMCRAFAVNGSVTNTYGADDPTAAHAYVLPGDSPVAGAYPDLGRLPTMVIPALAVVVGEAVQQAPQ
jgi:hypothetical protein